MIKKIIVVFITLFISIAGFAQISSTSVYSFFGVGDRNTSATTEQLSMGGVGVSFAEAHRINLSNPAANASLKFTNYTLSMVSKNSWSEQNGVKEQGAATYISYFAMGFNVGKKGGLSFGLLPNTSVGYNLASRVLNDDDETTNLTLYQGEGGTNRFYFGYGYSPIEGLNLGVQWNYIFGKIENNIIDQRLGAVFASKYETISNVQGSQFDLGFQYKKNIYEEVNVYVGGNFTLDNDVTSKQKEYLYTVSLNNFDSPRDTLLNKTSTAYFKNPLKSTVGIGLGRENKWYAGVDYAFQKPVSLEGTVYTIEGVKYDNYSKLSIGGFYTPKYNSILSYWNRITYRAGVKFENSGLLIDGDRDGQNFEALEDFGISFGVGFPVGKQQLSNLNFGFEYGKRGNTDQNLVKENYFNFRMSISLNDKWFQKQQIY
jgi:hypothetical protein